MSASRCRQDRHVDVEQDEAISLLASLSAPAGHFGLSNMVASGSRTGGHPPVERVVIPADACSLCDRCGVCLSPLHRCSGLPNGLACGRREQSDVKVSPHLGASQRDIAPINCASSGYHQARPVPRSAVKIELSACVKGCDSALQSPRSCDAVSATAAEISKPSERWARRHVDVKLHRVR